MSYHEFPAEKAALLADGPHYPIFTDSNLACRQQQQLQQQHPHNQQLPSSSSSPMSVSPHDALSPPLITPHLLSFTIYPTTDADLADNELLWYAVRDSLISQTAARDLLRRRLPAHLANHASLFSLLLPAPLAEFLRAVSLPEMHRSVLFMLADAAQGDDNLGLNAMSDTLAPAMWTALRDLLATPHVSPPPPPSPPPPTSSSSEDSDANSDDDVETDTEIDDAFDSEAETDSDDHQHSSTSTISSYTTATEQSSSSSSSSTPPSFAPPSSPPSPESTQAETSSPPSTAAPRTSFASLMLDAALQTAQAHDYWKIEVQAALCVPRRRHAALHRTLRSSPPAQPAAPYAARAPYEYHACTGLDDDDDDDVDDNDDMEHKDETENDYSSSQSESMTNITMESADTGNVNIKVNVDEAARRGRVAHSLFRDWHTYEASSALCDLHDAHAAAARRRVALDTMTALVEQQCQEETWERVRGVRECALSPQSLLSTLPAQVIEHVLIPRLVFDT